MLNKGDYKGVTSYHIQAKEKYEEEAKRLAEEGLLEEAKKQYILAKEIYAALRDEDKVTQIENRIQIWK